MSRRIPILIGVGIVDIRRSLRIWIEVFWWMSFLPCFLVPSSLLSALRMILNYLILRLSGHHSTGVRPLSYRSWNRLWMSCLSKVWLGRVNLNLSARLFGTKKTATVFAWWSITGRSILRSCLIHIICRQSIMLLYNFQVPLYFQSSILSRHFFRSPLSHEVVEPSTLTLACLNLTDYLWELAWVAKVWRVL